MTYEHGTADCSCCTCVDFALAQKWPGVLDIMHLSIAVMRDLELNINEFRLYVSKNFKTAFIELPKLPHADGCPHIVSVAQNIGWQHMFCTDRLELIERPYLLVLSFAHVMENISWLWPKQYRNLKLYGSLDGKNA